MKIILKMSRRSRHSCLIQTMLVVSMVSSVFSQLLTNFTRDIKLEETYHQSLAGPSVDDNWAFYSLDLAHQFNGTLPAEPWDLVLEVENSGTKFSDPNIYVNFDILRPTLTSFKVKCAFFGEDFCVLSSQELKDVQQITIGIFCDQQCQFNFQASIAEELLLDTGRSYKFFFQADQERIMRFEIPNDPNITTVEIKGINQNKFNSFNMIMTKGNSLPNSDNALYLRPAWENGYVGKFTEDCSCFCRGCNYTILVTSEDEGFITVSAKVSGQVVDLMKGSTNSQDTSVVEIQDSVMYYHNQCYKYQVKKADQDLRIKIESYSGDPNIFVNPNEIPQTLWLSKFNSRDHFENEELVLTPKQRGNETIGDYYICIFGNTASTYKLTISNEDHDIFLKSGISESGYIEGNETQLFYYRDPILAVENVNISFSLHVMIGKARLKAKLCPLKFNDKYEDFQKSCLFTDEEMSQDNPEERVEAHLGQEIDKTDTEMCKMPKSKRDGQQVSCVLVVGIYGLASFTTHYSVLLKIQEEQHHTILFEGTPLKNELQEVTPQYFMATINDPKVTKVTFQLTTIHGDPDIFISRSIEFPSPSIFEKRSIRCGIYPEQVEYEAEANKTLEGPYYIAVYGFVQSIYSLAYFTHSSWGQDSQVKTSLIKLYSGQLQKGVLHDVSESRMYFFKLSNDMTEDVQIRLQGENGNFVMYMDIDNTPTPTKYFKKSFDSIIITPDYMSNTTVSSFYILVTPMQYEVKAINQSVDTAGMAFQFTIAFYESSTMLDIPEGKPLSFLVKKDRYQYFQFQLLDFQNDSAYEIALTPKSGNPDLVLSFNTSNKFPVQKNNDYISEEEFAADSIIVDLNMIQQYLNRARKQGKKLIKIWTIYIGVYTIEDTDCSFSILITKKQTFSPILLINGQAQSGSLEPNETKFYYFKTSGYIPLYAILTPQTGNPNLELRIIQNLEENMNKWPRYIAQQADYFSKESFDSDVISLDNNNLNFKQKCAQSCILLLSIDGNSTKSTSHFYLQITRDLLELTDGLRVSGSIQTYVNYRFFRFFKACGDECCVEFRLEAHSMFSGIEMSVMLDKGDGSLPTRSSKAHWQVKETVASIKKIKIDSDDSKISELKEGNKFMYLIAVYSQDTPSFFLTASTIPKSIPSFSILDLQLSLTGLISGEKLDIILMPNQTRYIYYENWSPAPLKFQYEPDEVRLQPELLVEMNVTHLDSGAKLPRKQQQLRQVQWITNQWSPLRFANSIKIESSRNQSFCIECYYIMSIRNMRQKDSVSIKVSILQEDELGRGFAGHIIIGKPQNLKLTQGEKAMLSFKVNKKSDKHTLNIQQFVGKAGLILESDGQQLDLIQQDNIKAIQQYGIQIFSSQGNLQIKLSNLDPQITYILLIKPQDSLDLHINLLLTSDTTLNLIAEGFPLTLTFNNTQPNSDSSLFFTYLPPSSNFQLSIHASSFNPFTLSFKRLSLSSLDISPHIRLLEKGIISSTLLSPAIIDNSPWWTKYEMIGEYENQISTNDDNSSTEIYRFLPFRMELDEDMILVKITGQEEIKLTVTSSDIQYLQVGASVKGHVSNYNQTFKIYQMYIQQDKQEEDLYIEVTPCNGRVTMFVSDDYEQLFSDKKKSGFIDLVSQPKFGRLTSRIPKVGQYQSVFLGLTSTNELYSGLQEQLDSYFEISSRYVKVGENIGQNQYQLNEGQKGIELRFGGSEDKGRSEDPEEVFIRWGQIYHKSKASSLIANPYQAVNTSLISYQIYAATEDRSVYSLNSLCSIQHAPQGSLFSIYFSQTEEEDREVRIRRSDLKSIKALGVIATIKDLETHQLFTLAYDPLILQKHQVFGVRLGKYHFFLILSVALTVIVFLGILVYCLRKRHIFLKKRLDHEISYQEQQSEFADVTFQNTSKNTNNSTLSERQ